jgi:hypothetical protein
MRAVLPNNVPAPASLLGSFLEFGRESSEQGDATFYWWNRALGIKFLPGDLVAGSTTTLSDLFRNFHTVIGCAGFVAGRGIRRSGRFHGHTEGPIPKLDDTVGSGCGQRAIIGREGAV